MSLINDALKRAGQKPAAAPSTVDLRPTEEEQRPNSFPLVTLFIALIPLLALGMWFVAKGLQLSDQPKAVPAETVAGRAPEVAPAAPVAVPVVLPLAVVPATAQAGKPAIQQTESLRHEVVYKLQGIYWRPSKPSAVVNGKTVYVGDRVESARVTAIDQESVTLSVNGETKVLLIP